MVYMILAIQCGNVRPSQGTTTLVAEKTKAAKVVRLTKRVLPLAVTIVCREEFGCNYLTAILYEQYGQPASLQLWISDMIHLLDT